MQGIPTPETRAKISLVDAVMTFAVLVVLVGVSPWLWQMIGMIQAETDALTGVLLGLILPLMFVALLLSMGVSARSQ